MTNISTPQVELSSEIASENKLLGDAIQAAFENVRALAQRLQPILRSVPHAVSDDKNPESVLSELGASLRSHRRDVEGMASAVHELLQTLAL